MIPLKSRPQALPSSAFGRKPRRRLSPQLLIGGGVLLALLLIAGFVITTQVRGDSHAAARDEKRMMDREENGGKVTTINGLNKIAMIGSTADILDKNGNKLAANPDPYGVAIAPQNAGNLKKGDLLVTNIGNDKKGMTIVKFTGQKGPGRLFNTQGDGILGPADLVFGRNGNLWVANSTGNNLQVLNANGKIVATIKDPLFNGPWGIATNGKNTFFTANKLDAKILRVDVMNQEEGMFKVKVTQIAQFDKMPEATKIGLLWLPEAKVAGRNLKDVLLALDPTNNRIAALPNSSKLRINNAQNTVNNNQNTATDNQNQNMPANGTTSVNGTQDANGNQITTQAPNTQAAMATQVAQAANAQTPANLQGKGITVFQGKPLNTPGGFTINPLNGDLLVVNLADNNLVELNMAKQTVVGTKQIDPLMVDNQGNNSALFGVAAIKDEQGNLRVFFTDDNTNSLNVLSVK